MSEFNLSPLSHLSPPDQRLFYTYGCGPVAAPEFTDVLTAYRHQARLRPHAVAAEFQGRSISYSELERQSDRLAAKLIHCGVKPGDNVGLFLKRSLEMVIGLLAILKTGAAYVPQDARLTPEPQLNHIVHTADIKVILTLSELQHAVPQDGIVCLAIDSFFKTANAQAPTLPLLAPRPDAACFILFTSGTTGQPNGVRVTHGNVANIILTSPGHLGMKPGLKVSQILNIAFDMAAWEILGSLSHGCTLLIRGRDIEETVCRADVVIATPSILASVNPERCQNVRTVAVAGEPCPRPLADRWAAFCRFYNCCGPTEVTIVNTMQLHDPENSILSIGKPTPNNTVYILDENLQPCPIGEIGEMWAGGDCVSSGYLNNPQLTSERYQPDPFYGSGRMMFRTRDLGRWTKEGELEHFGRTDDQVKIRGFRVELDAVSAALESISGCEQAVTLKLDSRNLVAFVRTHGAITVSEDKMRQVIEERLPYYCVPSLLIHLNEFPVTSRGKIDKRALTVMAVREQEKSVSDFSVLNEVTA